MIKASHIYIFVGVCIHICARERVCVWLQWSKNVSDLIKFSKQLDFGIILNKINPPYSFKITTIYSCILPVVLQTSNLKL